MIRGHIIGGVINIVAAVKHMRKTGINVGLNGVKEIGKSACLTVNVGGYGYIDRSVGRIYGYRA